MTEHAKRVSVRENRPSYRPCRNSPTLSLRRHEFTSQPSLPRPHEVQRRIGLHPIEVRRADFFQKWMLLKPEERHLPMSGRSIAMAVGRWLRCNERLLRGRAVSGFVLRFEPVEYFASTI